MKRIHDYYFKKAKREGFPARSVYKLKEIQKRFHIIRRGQWVLDLGAFPGSWTKYAAGLVGPRGGIIAVDLKGIKNPPENVVVLEQDVFTLTTEKLKDITPRLDVVLSDMAPATTGRRDVDHLRSIALSERALDLANGLLHRKGTFLCKVFQGEDLNQFRKLCLDRFHSIRLVKPKSSRKESVEIFLLCSGKVA